MCIDVVANRYYLTRERHVAYVGAQCPFQQVIDADGDVWVGWVRDDSGAINPVTWHITGHFVNDNAPHALDLMEEAGINDIIGTK